MKTRLIIKAARTTYQIAKALRANRKRYAKVAIPRGYDAVGEPVIQGIIGHHLIVTVDEGHGARIQGKGVTRRETAALLHILAGGLEESGILAGEPDVDLEDEGLAVLVDHVRGETVHSS